MKKCGVLRKRVIIRTRSHYAENKNDDLTVQIARSIYRVLRGVWDFVFSAEAGGRFEASYGEGVRVYSVDAWLSRRRFVAPVCICADVCGSLGGGVRSPTHFRRLYVAFCRRCFSPRNLILKFCRRLSSYFPRGRLPSPVVAVLRPPFGPMDRGRGP